MIAQYQGLNVNEVDTLRKGQEKKVYFLKSQKIKSRKLH